MSLFVNESQLASADAIKLMSFNLQPPATQYQPGQGTLGGKGGWGGEQAKCWALMRAELAVLSDFT